MAYRISMGVDSVYLKCSHPDARFKLRNIPPEFRAIIEQHSEVDPWCQHGYNEDTEVTLHEVLSGFCSWSRIYGYLTPEYLAKWERAFRFIMGLPELQDEISGTYLPNVWVLFQCRDYNTVYSLSLNNHTGRVDTLTMSLYRNNPDYHPETLTSRPWTASAAFRLLGLRLLGLRL